MGKTFGAIQWAAARAKARRFPLLVVDSVAALNFRGWPRIQHAASLANLWRGGAWAWTPRDAKEVDAACELVIRCGRVVVLVDESAEWLDSARGRGGALERLYRTARHPDVYVALTTQYAGSDIPRPVLACRPSVYIYSTRPPHASPGSVPVSLGALGRQYGIDDAAADALPPHKCIFRT